jgi:hypothetical protein
MPPQGMVLNTTFVWTTMLWTDENFPLSYSMMYYAHSIEDASIVMSGGIENQVKTLMGQGLPSLNYQVTCVAIAYDSMGASANTSTLIKVYPVRNGLLQNLYVSAVGALTFAKTLRSILRQDPDVILVGEIRDADTARIAFQAAHGPCCAH